MTGTTKRDTPFAMASKLFCAVSALLLTSACGGAIYDEAPTGGGGAGQGGGTGGDDGGGGDGGGGGDLLGGDCDPMVPSHCGLPFPSNVYLVDDPTGRNPSGKSVRFGETTLPTRASDGQHIAPSMWLDHDGFSPASSPMTHMPGATATGLPTPYTIPTSLEDDSPTVLIEADTGRHVPHWVDIDMSTDQDDRRLLMIRPAERLSDGTRYVVAIRGVVDAGGSVLAPSPVFEALRSGGEVDGGTEEESFTVEARRDLYDDIFGILEAEGVSRDDLQIAWDFTTASRESNTGALIEMRDLALAEVGAEGPTFEILSVEEFPNQQDHPYLRRRIEVAMTVPLYLTNDAVTFGDGDPLALLNRDEEGNLVQNGTMTLPVVIHIPRGVTNSGPHGLLQNGHGLFGSRNEGRNGYLARIAEENHYIAFSVNLFGFDEDAESLAARVLAGQYEALEAFTERQIQGVVNQLLAMRMMMGRIATDGITDENDNVLLDPAWIDADVRAYRGDSQGGIMGATYMAVTTDVTRGLLGEPGMAYTLLLNRSVDWFQYAFLLQNGYGDDAIDAQLILNLLQLMWDRVEPSGFAPFIQNDPLPGTPEHSVILHLARGDHQVTTFSAHLLARAIGARQLVSDDDNQPVFEDPFGIERVTGPVTDESVMVEFDFGLPPNPAENLPQAEGCDPHDRVRVLDPALEQQDTFFRTGVIEWACDGACNCEDVGNDPNEEGSCDASFDDQCVD